MKNFYYAYVVFLRQAFLLFLFVSTTYAQLPICDDGLIYYQDLGNTIWQYDPSQPIISPTNPKSIPLKMPIGSNGLALGPNLFASSPSVTFYTTFAVPRSSLATYYYYDGSNWVNTLHTLTNSTAINMGAGGRYVYNLDGLSGNVYRYDGTGNDVLLMNLPDFVMGGPLDIHCDIDGNFYILRTDTPNQYLRKYCPDGLLLEEWSLTDAPPQKSGGGFTIIDDKLYYNNDYGLFMGLISGNDITVSLITSDALPYGATDFAGCPLQISPGIIQASIDTAYYCINAPSIPISAVGPGDFTWSVINGTATINGSGTSITVTASTTSKIRLTSSCLAKSDTIVIIVPLVSVDAGAPETTSSCISNLDTLHGSLNGATPGINYLINWSPATTIIAKGNTLDPTINPQNDGYYTLTVSSPADKGGCVSRDSVLVTLKKKPSTPIVSSPINLCKGSTSTALTATGTALLWYSSANGGVGSSTAPQPSTTSTGSTTYYVSQTVNGCESLREPITVTVFQPTVPLVTSPLTYCPGEATSPLSATGNNLLWYTSSSGGSGSNTAPTPSTASVGSTTYYVSQSLNSCESNRSAIIVNVSNTVPMPSTSNSSYCQHSTASALTAVGSNLLWYASASGGSGSTTAPVPSTLLPGTTTYYVSQTKSCGESARNSLSVKIVDQPLPPTVSDLSYCQGITANPLSAVGQNIIWYDSPSIPSGSGTPPTPSTATDDSLQYYVSQTVNGCESSRATLNVFIYKYPTAPGVLSPINYCQNSTAVPLSASGKNLTWYSELGIRIANSPTPSTLSIDTIAYYVSQSNQNCESNRSRVAVIIHPNDLVDFNYPNSPYCTNSPNPFASGNFTAGGRFVASPSTMQWINDEIGIIDLSRTPAGTYTVTYSTSGTQCPRSSTPVNIRINPSPNAAFHYASNTFCTEDSNAIALNNSPQSILQSFDTRVLSGTGSLRFLTGSIGTLDLKNSNPGLYRVYNTALNNGCQSIDSTDVRLKSSPLANFTLPLSTCIDAPINITVTSPRPLNPNSSFKWTYENGSPKSSDNYEADSSLHWLATAKGRHAITFQVMDSGCSSPLITQFIDVLSPPEVNINSTFDSINYAIVQNPKPIVFNAYSITTDTNTLNYQWNMGDPYDNSPLPNSSSITYVYQHTGDFIVTLKVSNAENCFVVKTIPLKVIENYFIHPPTVFSPNGDLVNDVFRPATDMNIISLQIFDRWGGKVYESSNGQEGWDGSSAPDGTYVYLFKFLDKESKPRSKSGLISIVR